MPYLDYGNLKLKRYFSLLFISLSISAHALLKKITTIIKEFPGFSLGLAPPLEITNSSPVKNHRNKLTISFVTVSARQWCERRGILPAVKPLSVVQSGALLRPRCSLWKLDVRGLWRRNTLTHTYINTHIQAYIHKYIYICIYIHKSILMYMHE